MKDYVKELRELVGGIPLILVGATVVVVNEKEEILLQRRSDVKMWGLPGGARNPGESLEETARREVWEETGLEVGEFRFVEMISGEEGYTKYPNGDEVYGVTAIYEAREVNGQLEIRDGESLEQRYFSLDDLPEDAVGMALLVLEKYKNSRDG